MKKMFQLTAIAAAFMAVTGVANASLIANGTVETSAQGFGNTPRLLTLQGQGNNTTESAAIGVNDGAVIALTPGIGDASVFMGNGITNVGGDTVAPLSDNQKYGIPTLGELNWTTAANVGLLFNAAEPNSDGVNIQDVTLKFYNGNTVIAAIDGSFILESTNPGTGNAGFLISVDQVQQDFLNTNVFGVQGASGFRIALEATIDGVAGGTENFSALSIAAVPEPQTYAMMLAGLGLLGFARVRRSKQAS